MSAERDQKAEIARLKAALAAKEQIIERLRALVQSIALDRSSSDLSLPVRPAGLRARFSALWRR